MLALRQSEWQFNSYKLARYQIFVFYLTTDTAPQTKPFRLPGFFLRLDEFVRVATLVKHSPGFQTVWQDDTKQLCRLFRYKSRRPTEVTFKRLKDKYKKGEQHTAKCVGPADLFQVATVTVDSDK